VARVVACVGIQRPSSAGEDGRPCGVGGEDKLTFGLQGFPGDVYLHRVVQIIHLDVKKLDYFFTSTSSARLFKSNII
jgi:hypothetical protein